MWNIEISVFYVRFASLIPTWIPVEFTERHIWSSIFMLITIYSRVRFSQNRSRGGRKDCSECIVTSSFSLEGGYCAYPWGGATRNNQRRCLVPRYSTISQSLKIRSKLEIYILLPSGDMVTLQHCSNFQFCVVSIISSDLYGISIDRSLLSVRIHSFDAVFWVSQKQTL